MPDLPPPPPRPGWVPPTLPPGMPSGPPVDRRRRFGFVALVVSALAGALAGAIAAIVGMVVLALVLGPQATASVYGSYRPPREGETGIEAGRCASSEPDLFDPFDRSDQRRCKERHASQVIGIASYPSGLPRPTGKPAALFVSEACGLFLRSYVGANPERTSIGFGAVVPGPAAWKAGERRIWCLVDSYGLNDGVGSARERRRPAD